MAKTEVDFEIAADADALQAFMTDPELVSKIIPFVESTDEEGRWVLKDQQSKVTQTKRLVPTLTVGSGGRIEWVGKGEKLTVTLRMEVRPDKKACSKVKAELMMDIEGPLGVVLAPIISLNIRNQIDSIVRSLRDEFEDPTLPTGECRKCPVCGQ